jgi:hypothetical protein
MGIPIGIMDDLAIFKLGKEDKISIGQDFTLNILYCQEIGYVYFHLNQIYTFPATAPTK